MTSGAQLPGAAALARIRIVLLAPREPGNVGAAARAMKNLGLGSLVLAAAPDLDLEQARRMAVHATDVLDRCRSAPTLADAVADCGVVAGTSGRATVMRAGAVSPRDAAPRLIAATATNDVAIVFGPEDHGLSTEELARCEPVIAIPTSDAYPSMNLAQAVLLCAYELRLAAADTTVGARRILAADERRELMLVKLEAALGAIGFLHGEGAPHVMRQLRRMLGRAELDEREVDVLLGVARQIAWAARFIPAAGSDPALASDAADAE